MKSLLGLTLSILLLNACSRGYIPTSTQSVNATPTPAPVSIFDTNNPVTSNLFDTTLGSSEVPASTTTSVTSTTSPQIQACLNQNGFEQSIYTQNGVQYCINSSQTGYQYPINESTIFGLGLEVYEDMDSCLIAVLQAQPQSDNNAAYAHQIGTMALIRCYRNVVNNMARILPWGQHQQQAYQQQDQNLAWVLFQLTPRN